MARSYTYMLCASTSPESMQEQQDANSNMKGDCMDLIELDRSKVTGKRVPSTMLLLLFERTPVRDSQAGARPNSFP